MDAIRRHGFLAAAALSALAWLVMSIGMDSAYALIPGLLALVLGTAGLTQRSAYWGTLSASVLGLLCSWYLLQGKLEGETGLAGCSIDSWLDCGAVNDSPWSMAFGLPITLIGLSWYAGVIAALLTEKRAEVDGRLAQAVAWTALSAVLYSVVLAWVSKQMGVFCIVCFTMYGANAVILWGAVKIMREHDRRLVAGIPQLFSHGPTGTLALVFVVGIVGGQRWWDGAADVTAGVERTEDGTLDYSAFYAKPAGPVTFTGDEPVKGDPSAPVVVVEFADFGCPHCARAAKELKDLVALRPDVQVRFKPFALSGICNPALPDQGIGQERCDAAKAAVCAQEQGKFWEMSQLLFTNQRNLDMDSLSFMAGQAGLDTAAWTTCMDGAAAGEIVTAAGKAGGDVGIRGTPAFFVKGLVGDDFVEITRGVPAILELLEARDDGRDLPAPR